jgi:hypothetical protein
LITPAIRATLSLARLARAGKFLVAIIRRESGAGRSSGRTGRLARFARRDLVPHLPRLFSAHPFKNAGKRLRIY